MWIYWSFFSKNLNQKSLTPTWPLTPCLLRSHVWLYPRIIVSKSHDNTSMYVDTVINLANYHIHTHVHIHTTYRMRDHIVSYWTQFRRDKKVTHSYTNRPDFGQNFDKVTSPPFFYLLFFCFSNFLRFKPILAQASEKIEKLTHSYKILHRYGVIDILIYQEELHMLVAYPRRVFCTEYNSNPPPPRSNIS